MIPKNSTPIKNEILIDIFAKGKLTQPELRIVLYIIRWSWGFDGKHRRQDFTKELSKREISKDIGMDEGLLNRTINKMTKENKIVVKDRCYQFNEHLENWKNLTHSQTTNDKNDKKLDSQSNKTCLTVKQNLTHSQTKLDCRSSLTPEKPIQNNDLLDRKENKRNYKETLKKKGDNFKNTWIDFKKMRTKIKKPMTLRAEELILKELEKLTTNENTQIAILNQSIMNSWQGVFPLKDNHRGRDSPKKMMSIDEALKIINEKEGEKNE